MEFIDLKSQQKLIRSSLNQSINKVLDRGDYILGEEVNLLESELSFFTNSKHVIGCSNGTDALIIALLALGIKPGDGVITVPFTYIATLEAIATIGAIPILVDVYDSTFNINPEKIYQVMKNSKHNIKAIMPVDLFGLPARYRLIREISQEFGLKVIGDAAQSFGASINGIRVGKFADITTTSFFPAKPLGCYGDGGAIFTDSDEHSQIIKSLAVHGKGTDKYDNIRIGLNSRLDTLQAAVLIEKLKIFKKEIELRNKFAELYRDKLKNTNLRFQYIPKNYHSVYAQFSILFESQDLRDQAQLLLKKNNIPSVVYYSIPGHLQKGYSYLKYKAGDFPVSEKLSKTILSLPMHAYLDEKQINQVVNILKIVK
jgi:UDP-2-acetamido-2-deoxy-ribo-hexuluronate aminotransferase